MKTILPGFALAIAIASLAMPASAQTVVRIGHVAALTGASAHLGKDNENAARMAIDELNARKLRIAGQEIRFELLSEDDAGDPQQAVAAARKLVHARVVGVIGHLNSGTTISASRIYHDAGIPQISPSATHPKYTRQGFDTAFRVVATDLRLGGTLGRYAVRELKADSIAVIDDGSAYGESVADEFQAAAKAAGANIVGRESTTVEATDFEAILAFLEGTKPELVFFGGMDTMAGPMLRRFAQRDIPVRFMGGDGICTPRLATLAGEAIVDDQVVCAEAGGVTREHAGAIDDWKQRYRDRFKTEVQIYAPYAYDATMTMVAAMQVADSTVPGGYLPELAKIVYDGITGPIAFDESGDIRNGALTFYTYRSGEREKMMVVK
ncbi:MAG: branched-chain amino acid ABC transporter substrate-binding protein [Burkholderiaceae bacterium]